MKVQKKDQAKDDLERYYTPHAHALAHVRHLYSLGIIKKGEHVLDAGCGDGAYMRALKDVSDLHGLDLHIVGVDADPTHRAAVSEIGEFVAMSFFEYGQLASLVIGNPPFSLAARFIEHGLTVSPMVSFLLQSQYVSGVERYGSGMWGSLYRLDPFVSRPRFYGPAVDLINERRAAEGKPKAGGNTVDYSAFTFKRGHSGDFLGRHIQTGD